MGINREISLHFRLVFFFERATFGQTVGQVVIEFKLGSLEIVDDRRSLIAMLKITDNRT